MKEILAANDTTATTHYHYHTPPILHPIITLFFLKKKITFPSFTPEHKGKEQRRNREPKNGTNRSPLSPNNLSLADSLLTNPTRTRSLHYYSHIPTRP
jgi:hypothetical protein